MRIKNAIHILFGMFLFSGCATVAKGPGYADAKSVKANPALATLYVFREYAEPTAWGANIQIDGNPVADLSQGGFTWVYVKPGKTEIKAVWPGMSSQKDSSIAIETAAGKSYYVELVGISQATKFTLTTVYFKIGSGLNQIKPDAAVKKLEACCKFQKPVSDTL